MATDAPDLAPLFDPRGVAFVGASDDQSRYGGRVLRYCLDGGYRGQIHVVNPKRRTVQGLPSHPHLSAVEGPVDVVVALVGPERIPELHAAAKGRARFLIALGDVAPRESPDREARLDALKRAVEAGGPRIVGPQSIGIILPHQRLAMSGSSALPGGLPAPGTIGFISQSGGILGGVLDRARRLGIGFSHMVSSGLEFDLTLADYLAFMVEDERTRAIAIYAEGLGDCGRLFDLADRARERDKPILLLKPGHSKA
ncbi:MAG: CoA-binding protein, partial [Alphaproteobacteria bacterium]